MQPQGSALISHQNHAMESSSSGQSPAPQHKGQYKSKTQLLPKAQCHRVSHLQHSPPPPSWNNRADVKQNPDRHISENFLRAQPGQPIPLRTGYDLEQLLLYAYRLIRMRLSQVSSRRGAAAPPAAQVLTQTSSQPTRLERSGEGLCGQMSF